MTLSEYDLDYFDKGKMENPRFWSRLGETPRLEGAKILDVGCGHGSLCVQMALAGAACVIGVDLDEDRVAFAQENLRTNYPALTNIEFRCVDLSDLPENDFDIIVSKDTFEHIIGLDICIDSLAQRLRPGGRLYAGFGPLYHSPFGDHRRTRAGFPWGHVIIPEPILLWRLRKRGRMHVDQVYDLGLNKLSVWDYRLLSKQSGLRVVRFQVNVSHNPISKVFKLLSYVPGIGKYFAHNLYCILEKPLDQPLQERRDAELA